MVVQKAVGRLCPLQDDIRTLAGVHCNETPVNPAAVALKHTYFNLYSGISQTLYTAAAHPGKRVNATYYHAPYPF